MLRFLLVFALGLFMQLFCNSQNTQIDNGDFEDWGFYDLDDKGQVINLYEVPNGNWTTNNRITLLFASLPPVVTKITEDVVSGNYAAKITSGYVNGSFPVAGLLGTGFFTIDILNPINSYKPGAPFTERPSCFNGHYKYTPVGTDTAEFYTLLTKWRVAENFRDTIGIAYNIETNVVDQWTPFELPFTYFSDEDPDTIITVFTPSIQGDLVPAGVVGNGSTLIIDDLMLGYEGECMVGINEVNELDYIFLQSESSFSIEINGTDFGPTKITMIDASGRILLQEVMNQPRKIIDIAHIDTGIYFVLLEQGKRRSTQSFSIHH